MLSRQESDIIKHFSRLTFAMIISTFLIPILLLTVRSYYTFTISYRVLLLVVSIISGILCLLNLLMFFKKGVRGHSMYLNIISLIMYMFALMCLYVSAALIFFMSKASLGRNKTDHFEICVTCSVVMTILSLFTI